MTKIMTKVLLVVMIVNAALSNFTFSVFATTQPKANSETSFTWNKDATLDEDLAIVTRSSDSDEVMLSWDIDQLNGTAKDSGKYTLKYPLAENKVAEFEITKKPNKMAIVEYKINGISNVNQKNNNKLVIYKDGSYKEPNKTNFPGTDGFSLAEEKDGVATNLIYLQIMELHLNIKIVL